MRDLLVEISSLAFGGAILASIILNPEIWIFWGIRIGVGIFLVALGWEIVLIILRKEK